MNKRKIFSCFSLKGEALYLDFSVIDTNVIVSALIFSKSTTMQAFREAKENGLILIYAEILSELIDVLSREKFDRYL